MSPDQIALRLVALGLAAALGALSLADPAEAQDPAEDWDLTTDAPSQLALASLDFGTNQIALRCRAGTLDLLFTGVPATNAALQPVTVTAGPMRDERQTWRRSPGQPVISPFEPERLARQLRAGGEFDMVLEASEAGGRPNRYRLPVPASAASVDDVLSACSVPLADDWDLRPRFGAGLPEWSIQPTREFPERAASRGVENGETRLACLATAQGALTACRIVSEAPVGAGFGESALRSLGRARLKLPGDGRSVADHLVAFTMRFQVS